MAQNHVLSYVSCLVGRCKNLLDSCESSWNEDAKIGIGFVSISSTSREKKNLTPNSLGFIDVDRTVAWFSTA